MNEELDCIEENNTYDLVHRPKDKIITGTTWIFNNNLNVEGQVITSK